MNHQHARDGVSPLVWNALAQLRPSGGVGGQSLADPTAVDVRPVPTDDQVPSEVRRNPDGSYTAFGVVWASLQAASVFACLVHGYRRNNGSVGWALGWAFMAGLFPVVMPAFAVAQGYGVPIDEAR